MEKLIDLNHVVLKGHFLSFQVNGIPVTCNLAKASDVLAKASADQVAKMIADPVGLGFHWPELDEDLSVHGILRDAGIQLASEKAKTAKTREVA